MTSGKEGFGDIKLGGAALEAAPAKIVGTDGLITMGEAVGGATIAAAFRAFPLGVKLLAILDLGGDDEGNQVGAVLP
jgi:uncharacterized protein (UPF0261 family)